MNTLRMGGRVVPQAYMRSIRREPITTSTGNDENLATHLLFSFATSSLHLEIGSKEHTDSHRRHLVSRD